MEPPDDGRKWVRSTGVCPDEIFSERIWTILNDGRMGGTKEHQQHGNAGHGWVWAAQSGGSHHVAFWTADPPCMPKSGVDMIAMMIAARGEDE